MWVDTACVSVSRFYSHNEEQKQLLDKTMWGTKAVITKNYEFLFVRN